MFNIPLLVTRPEVKAVADRLTKKTGSSVTPAQVLLAWSEVGGHSVIPKSVTPSRIVENFKEVELSSDDIAEIENVGKEQRRYNIPIIANKPRWDVNIFGEDAEKTASHQVVLST